MRLSPIQEEARNFSKEPASDGRESSIRPSAAVDRMKLSEVFRGIETVVPAGAGELEIRQVVCDSRKVELRALFFALQGAKANGNTFIRDAVAHGAAVIASEEAAPAVLPGTVAWVKVPDARKALAIAAANFYGHPANALQLVAVTGTNGKTTTTSLIDAIVKASGAKTGLLGTIAYHTPLGEHPAPNTTPESLDLQSFFAEIRDAGGKFGVLEASSHSLSMDRLYGCHFAAAVFTNLTREHMDYHKSFENYFEAKRRLFEGTGAGTPDVAVINTDDEWGKKMVGLAKTTFSYGLQNGADPKAKKLQLSLTG